LNRFSTGTCCDRGLSGVQPKVLVPERPAAGDKGKAFGLTPDLIVKSGQKEFPGLAINEFVCMTAVARAGVAVPEFFLSEDRKLFVMRRFDRRQDGSALGFEDMAVLSGKGASRKYEGSYGLIAKVIQLFCSTESVPKALAQLFDMVALSCLLGNGDAHLKNFGVLYEDVVSGVVRMAPAYDIVNTTCYLPEDNLALSLSGNRGFFASRQTLLDFADVCNVSPKAARSRLLELCDVVTETFAEHRDLAAEVSGFSDDVTKRVKLFLEMFRPHSTLPDGQAPATGIKTKAKQSQHSSG
jgi:serine/threonine-protein kinase HipA